MTATITRDEARRRLDELQAPLGRVNEALDKARRQHERTPGWVHGEVDRIYAALLELREALDRLDEAGAVTS